MSDEAHKAAKVALGLPPDSPWEYVPMRGANAAICVIFAIFAAVTLYHRFRRPKGKRWGIALTIGLVMAAVGYGLRIPRSYSILNSKTIYAIQYLFVILSPCFFLAFNYITFGRFIIALDPSLTTKDMEDGRSKKELRREKSSLTFIPPRLVSRIFVLSDITTFFIQAAGGGLQTGGGSSAKTGNYVFIAGLAIQAVSYLFFWGLVFNAHRRIRQEPGASKIFDLSDPIMRLFLLLHFSSQVIMVRSIFRVVEMIQGYDGYLASHEYWLIAADTAQMIIATGIWVLQWPATLIDQIELSRHNQLSAYTSSASDASKTREGVAVPMMAVTPVIGQTHSYSYEKYPPSSQQ